MCGVICAEHIAGLFSHALLFKQVRLLQEHIHVQLHKGGESERESEVNGVSVCGICNVRVLRASGCVCDPYTSVCVYISIHRRTHWLCAYNCNGHAFG
jgi:hypothetical protein